MKKAVLFDLDGTLLDTAPDLVDTFNILLRRHQQPEITMQDMRHLLTHGSKFFITTFFRDELSETEINTVRTEFLEIYTQNAHQKTRAFPGMLELLMTLDERNIPWGIVTNKLTLHTMENLTRLKLIPHAIVCGDTLALAKPNPEPLWHACELMQVIPNEVIYIGDSEVDAEAGLRAGIDTLIVEHGYHEGIAQFENFQIAGFIRSPEEVLKWF